MRGLPIPSSVLSRYKLIFQDIALVSWLSYIQFVLIHRRLYFILNKKDMSLVKQKLLTHEVFLVFSWGRATQPLAHEVFLVFSWATQLLVFRVMVCRALFAFFHPFLFDHYLVYFFELPFRSTPFGIKCFSFTHAPTKHLNTVKCIKKLQKHCF